MAQHLAAIGALADERTLALRELLEQGYTRADIARGLGVTPAIVTKILKRPVDLLAGNRNSASTAAPAS